MFSVHIMSTFFLDTIALDGKSTKIFKALAATDSKSQSQTLSTWAWLIRLRLLQRMLSCTVRTGGEQSGISLQTQTGTDHRTKTADEGARVECAHFDESMPCPGGDVPRASCKHLAALLSALEEFSCIRFTKERFVCTDVL